MDIACTFSLVHKDPCPDVLVLSLDLKSRTHLFLSSTPHFLVLHPRQSPQGFCSLLVKLSGKHPCPASKAHTLTVDQDLVGVRDQERVKPLVSLL